MTGRHQYYLSGVPEREFITGASRESINHTRENGFIGTYYIVHVLMWSARGSCALLGRFTISARDLFAFVVVSNICNRFL